jgi:hypothetical protein
MRGTVAVPAVDEADALFDSKLHKKEIQPVWIEIENLSDEPAWFFHHSVDPDYFPPCEVAWRSRRTGAEKTNRAIDAYVYDQSAPLFAPARTTISGFVFINEYLGTKYVPVEILRVGAASRESPRGNLTGDPCFADGLRIVLFLTKDPTDFEDVRYLAWDEPPAPEAVSFNPARALSPGQFTIPETDNIGAIQGLRPRDIDN